MMRALSVAALVGVASGAFAPAINARPTSLRSSGVVMGGNKKGYAYSGFEYGGELFENREIDQGKPPVYLLKRIEELKLATALSEAGVLSTLEENKVFSSLEKAGAFSTAESLLPTIESLGLLTTFENALDVEAGLLFTAANFLIATFPSLFVLQICGFVPLPTGPVVPLEGLFGVSTLAAGAALWALAFAVSQLQED